MIQTTPIFAVPFGSAMHPEAPTLNAALRTLFLAREAEGAKWAKPDSTMRVNPGLFESHFDLFKWPEPEVGQLREFCWARLHELVTGLSTLPAASTSTLEITADVWFHITRRGGYFGLHNHAMASWSGVYCVDAGRDDGTHPDGGALTFANPFSIAAMFLDPANAAMRAPYNSFNRSFKLVPGQLIVFPSWLQHYVQPFHGEGERITVAFNAWFNHPTT